ncbi:MAG: SsrA-binding protein SmpB [Candidatus Azosocius agrarius]|nr:MAG: SsrA-binding protein SmpB [Gammaproteobacteria bacterium]
MKENIIITNKKAQFNYYLEKKYEAGIILKGWEVKSIRNKKIHILDSYIKIINNKLYIIEFNITPLTSNCTHVNIEIKRNKELLLNKKEIIYIKTYIMKKGYSVIPTKIYWKNNLIKIEIAIALGKKLYDKKKDIKEKELKKDYF